MPKPVREPRGESPSAQCSRGARVKATARERLHLLAIASHVLLSSPDYEATLAAVAKLVVPSLGDWCMVDMLDDSGRIHRLALAHLDESKLALAWDMERRYPVDPNSPEGVAKVLRTGRTVLYTEITDDLLRASARDAGHLRYLRELGITSAIVVPLMAREQTLGAITLVSSESGWRYGPEDVGFLEDLAGRAALAVDNTRLLRQAQEANERSQSWRVLLEAALQHMPAAVLIAEAPSGRILLGHQVINEMADDPPAVPVQSIADYDQFARVFPGHPPETWPLMRALRGETITGDELEFLRGNERRFVRASAAPVRDPSGRIIAAVATLTDITEARRTEEAMRTSEKLAATGRLAASIAHEINNPLESVTNLLFLLEHDRRLHQQARQYAALAQQELGRVSHIARQTLGFYRDTGTPVPVCVSELLENVLELYDRRLRSTGVKVTRQYETADEIHAFPGVLRQVFSNLIINAIESVGNGGRIRVHTFASTDWADPARRGVHVVIADDGTGIAADTRSRIFEPFFTTKGERGTGLGLWVSRGIVQKHGGQIRFRSSTRTGRSGTVFSVFLPAQGAQSRSTPAAA